ncbi:hypothetical protein B0H17DRAFT_1101531 [Mycena rosella]|uniref:Uncharacterized protein n=1 Tax=Mycena rosella TaxID=1033263 RepID=A0AAD7G069_MYCRO|nr:hypothetical protein B0H17DRAFT_1101531 [Mycena rosella]
MRKRWKAGTADAGKAPDKAKGKERARADDGEAMDVDVDDTGCVPPRMQPLTALSAGTSPSTSFARLSLVSPHPGAGGLRPAWITATGIVGADVLMHGVRGVREGQQKGVDDVGRLPAAPRVDGSPVADADADAAEVRPDAMPSERPDTQPSPHDNADALLSPPPPPAAPSPRVHFAVPFPDVRVEDAAPPEPDAASFRDEPEHEPEEDVLLMVVGADEPYRPSPASPSPAPESEEDEEMGVEEEEDPQAPVPVHVEEQEVYIPAEQERETSVSRAASVPVDQPASVPLEEEQTPAAIADVASVGPDAGPQSPQMSAPPPPAPPPVQVKMSLREWNALRKQREAEKALEDEREQERAEHEREQERERDGGKEKEKEKDCQGEDKENEVVPAPAKEPTPVKAEDGLSRVLDGIRRDAVGERPSPLREPPVHSFVQEEVDMPYAAPPLDAPPAGPMLANDEYPPKTRTAALTMAVFVPTGDHGGLSPLTVSSMAESRTPSPGLTTGAAKVKREPSPLIVNAFNPPKPAVSSSTLTTSQSPIAGPSKSLSPLPPRQHILHSPKAPRYPSPSFASNGVSKAVAAPPPKPFPTASSPSFSANVAPRPSPKPPPFSTPHLAAKSHPVWSSPSFASNGVSRPSPASPFSAPRPATPPAFKYHARVPSQEEGEILSGSSPPPPARRVPFVCPPGTQLPSAPIDHSKPPPLPAFSAPTQPRSYQQRAPPSAPRALREAQNPDASASGASTSAGGIIGGGRGGRFGGLTPQTMPQSVLEPVRERGNRRGHHNRKRR